MPSSLLCRRNTQADRTEEPNGRINESVAKERE